MANYVKGIGDALSGKNEIFPSFDAKIFRYIVQNIPGVCTTVQERFALTSIDRGVQIGPGMVQAMGYFGMSDAPTQLNFVYPTGSAQYAKVYAEINLSIMPNQFNIKATPQSSTSNIPLVQDDLAVTPSGIYQVSLYLLTINANGTITATDQRNILKKVGNAESAEQSTNAQNLISGGTIANNVTAVTQAQSDNTTKLATTAYVRSAIASATNITYGTISFAAGHGASGYLCKRQMNFVCGYISNIVGCSIQGSSLDRTMTIGYIPVNFRPKGPWSVGLKVATFAYSGNFITTAGTSASGWIEVDGQIKIRLTTSGNTATNTIAISDLWFGYEIA